MKPCPETFPYPLIALDETDSTNQYISRLCYDRQAPLTELTTVTAEFQSAGKGQRGNSWEAEKGKNLLFSFVLYPTFLEARRQFILSQIVSLSIKEELDKWSDEITIKWPNDIYWRDRKICGILIENDLTGHFIGRSISGIGININQNIFRSDAPNPVSLTQITHREHNRYEILASILKRIQIYYNGLQTEERDSYSAEIAARYARSLFRRRGFHPYEDADGRFSARLLRVEQDGRFVLEDENGKEREYLFKEVQYIV
ncbi:biotin--[acetyl-CoA-carboxylase] ligase [uncultured Bacteroides sp.]|uniref:biotin--[acetyl-CoA-carboxylase] ligase n=1 Tax=uncultured Bacteroides sp. TaxID=162156 RepID=UPI0025D9F652|nr:biotin--[acetyl-CoA-carboxylase] ligase [uncultured Bacteroides sp.]